MLLTEKPDNVSQSKSLPDNDDSIVETTPRPEATRTLSGLIIPSSDYSRLATLLSFSDENVAELLSALEAAPAALGVSSLKKDVSSRVSLPREIVDDTINLLMRLYAVQSESAAPVLDFVDAVTAAMAAADRSDLQPPNGDWEPFRRHLKALMEAGGALSVASKARLLSLRYERIFHDAQIVTDIRPVFKPEVADGLSGAVIVHTLRITYHTDNELQDAYITVDDEDLRFIRQIIERAIAKTTVLKELLQTASTPVIGE